MSGPICLPVRPISLLRSLLNTFLFPQMPQINVWYIAASSLIACGWVEKCLPLLLFPWRSLYWKSHGCRQREGVWFGVGGVEGRELFGPLTWMNCWSNVAAGNSWIVYINVINIALINHISVIYCCFLHLAPTKKLLRISQWSINFLLFCIQKVPGLQWFLKLDDGPTEYCHYPENY